MMARIVRDAAKRRWFLTSLFAIALTFALLLLPTSLLNGRPTAFSALFPCPATSFTPISAQVTNALLHYATTPVTPQQSRAEIGLSLAALRARDRPCNFLVFGLGHDSRMWAAFNAGGATLFLEEDPKWFREVLAAAPDLVARTVRYPTQLRQAEHLLRTYRMEPFCLPPKAHVRGNRMCPLALADLPEEVYEREWDVIMIDAPRGYYPQAPGRMGAIWSAAVMARNRKGKGPTDIFLHDVDRKVEKEFALQFLCQKYLVKGVQRLWHFRIPPVGIGSEANSTHFC